VHRDIKPSNIFLCSDGRVVLLDFGLVYVEEMTRLTGSCDTPGTFQNMAPEQLRGEPLDGRTDIYQLGVTLYRAASGELPFSMPQVIAFATDDHLRPAKSLSKLRPDLDVSTCRLIDKCCHPKREKRFQDARSLSYVIQELRHERPVNWDSDPSSVATVPVVVSDTQTGLRATLVRSWRRLVLLAIAILVVCLALVHVLVRSRVEAEAVLVSRDVEQCRERLDWLRAQLLERRSLPREQELLELGQLLMGQDFDAVGVRSETSRQAQALALVHLAESHSDDSVGAARAYLYYDRLLELFPLSVPNFQLMAVLDAAGQAAQSGLCSEAFAKRLRAMLDPAVLDVRAQDLRFRLARLLWRDHLVRHPHETLIQRELKGMFGHVLETDPALREAARVLEPVVRNVDDGLAPSVVELYFELLCGLRTRAAQHRGREILASIVQRPQVRERSVDFLDGFGVAASLFVLQPRDLDPACRVGDAEQSVVVLRAAIALVASESDRNLLQTWLVWLLAKADRLDGARTLAERLVPERLRKEARWRAYWAKGEAARQQEDLDAARSAWAKGRDVAPEKLVWQYFHRRGFEVGFEDVLLGGRPK